MTDRGWQTVDYVQGSGGSIRRRRQRRRAAVTLTFVGLMMAGTFVYAAAYFQGWVGLAPNKAAASTSCQTVTPTQALTLDTVTVNVYNATNRDGLARSVAKSLRTQGFKIGEIANDPLGRPLLGVGEVRHGKLGAKVAALAALRLPGAKVVLDKRTDDSVDLVLGNRFSALHVPSGVVKAKGTSPSAPPPQSC